MAKDRSRLLPYDIEIEQAVLGSMVIDAGALRYGLAHCALEDFWRDEHRIVFRLLQELSESGIPPDPAILKSRLVAASNLSDYDAAGYVTALFEAVGTSANIRSYVKALKDISRKRRLVMIGNELSNRARSSDESPESILGWLSEVLPRHQITPGSDVMAFEDLVCGELPQVQCVVAPLIPRPGITMITGEPASYKTWLVHSLALYVGLGLPYLGQFQVEQCGVLVYDAESDEALLRRRLSKLFMGLLLTSSSISSRIPVYVRPRPLKLETLEERNDAIETIKTYNIGLVIADPLIHCLPSGADENNARSIAAYFEAARSVIHETGCAIAYVHHARKRSYQAPSEAGQMIRGSSAIRGVLDSSLFVRAPHPGLITIEHDKSRRLPAAMPFAVQITDTIDGEGTLLKYVGAVEDTPDSQHSAALRAVMEVLMSAGGRMTRPTLIKCLQMQGISQRTANRVISELVSGGQLIKSGSRPVVYSLIDDAALSDEDDATDTATDY
jgi:hypothetical protein